MPAGGGAQVKAAGLTDAQLDSIVFTTSAGVHAEPLAEFAVFGVLAGAKQLPRLQQQQRDRQWPGRWAMGLVSSQTVVVVGLGSIGRRTAEKLSALGARVLGVHRRIVEVDGIERVYPMELLAEAVSQADAIVLCLPGTDATFEVVDDAVFDRVKPGATIVNVGRGTVVDEVALVGALSDGRLGFALLDVFSVEPLPASSPLWRLPNVVIAPHTAALNPAEDRSIAELFAENARRFLDGEPMINRVDTVEFY
jgi:phosphoglycerate dehydrogenase-like enzyme